MGGAAMCSALVVPSLPHPRSPRWGQSGQTSDGKNDQ